MPMPPKSFACGARKFGLLLGPYQVRKILLAAALLHNLGRTVATVARRAGAEVRAQRRIAAAAGSCGNAQALLGKLRIEHILRAADIPTKRRYM